jgi:hypothetical protein
VNSLTEPGRGQALELERWFGWQTAYWWRRWRGALLTCAALLLLWAAYEIVNARILAFWQTHKPNYAAHGWEFHWVKSWSSIHLIEQFMFYGILGVSLASAAMLAQSLASLPEEVALAFPSAASFRRRARRIRSALYLLFAVFLLTPDVFGHLNLWLQGLAGSDRAIPTVLFYAQELLKIAALTEILLLFALRWPRLHPYAGTAAGLLLYLAAYGLQQWSIVQALQWTIEQRPTGAQPSPLLTLAWSSPCLLFPLAIALACYLLSRYRGRALAPSAP